MDAKETSRKQSEWIAQQNKRIIELEKENKALRRENQQLHQRLSFEMKNEQVMQIVNHKQPRPQGFMKTYCVPVDGRRVR